MTRFVLKQVALFSSFAAFAACASSGTGSATARSLPDRLTRSEISTSNATNAYELINRLRPNWLRPPATGSISGGTIRSQMVLVYLDGQRLEDLSALRTISASSIQSAQWLDSSRAPTILRDVPAGPIAGAIVLKTQ